MASIVINHLQRSFPSNEVAILYIYCAYNAQYKAKELVAALLRQLVHRLTTLPEAVKDLHKRHTQIQTSPTREELTQVLGSVASGFSRVFVVIDALDECREEDNTRTEFLDSIKKIKQFANMLVTSRHIPAIKEEFKGELQEEIRATDEDITTYIKAKVKEKSSLSAYISAKPSLQADIVSKIVSKVNGM
jgi:hypothetical protein